MAGLVANLAVIPSLNAQEQERAVSKCANGSTPLKSLNFHFSGDSYRPGSNCGAPSCPDRLLMGGSGTITGKLCVGETIYEGKVTAQGSFAHYELTSPNVPGNDIPLKFTGTWKSTGLVSFELLGFLGTDSQGSYPLAAGALVLNIILVRPSTPAIPLTQVPSLLTIVSDLQTWPGVSIPAVPLSNSMTDGVTLIAPNPAATCYTYPRSVRWGRRWRGNNGSTYFGHVQHAYGDPERTAGCELNLKALQSERSGTQQDKPNDNREESLYAWGVFVVRQSGAGIDDVCTLFFRSSTKKMLPRPAPPTKLI